MISLAVDEKRSRRKFEFQNSLFAHEIFVRVNRNEQRHEKFVSRQTLWENVSISQEQK